MQLHLRSFLLPRLTQLHRFRISAEKTLSDRVLEALRLRRRLCLQTHYTRFNSYFTISRRALLFRTLNTKRRPAEESIKIVYRPRGHANPVKSLNDP